MTEIPVPSPYQPYYDYLAEHVIAPFYEERLAGLKALSLSAVLKRKNPYLFKAKNIEIAGDLVKGIVDAFLSSQEETKFGNFLEGFAIFVSARLHQGFKSTHNSLDLEFRRDGNYYIVGIKSGTSWGNSDQIRAMKGNFKRARAALRAQGIDIPVVAVNGCIYGKEKNSLKTDPDPDMTFYKYAGQDFWNFISGDDQLYQEIIVPIDEKAKEKDRAFKDAYAAKVNEMTKDFTSRFMKDDLIDWVKLVDFVSKRA
jgi:hypothetical protein